MWPWHLPALLLQAQLLCAKVGSGLIQGSSACHILFCARMWGLHPGAMRLAGLNARKVVRDDQFCVPHTEGLDEFLTLSLLES